jgi:hypothetical protein
MNNNELLMAIDKIFEDVGHKFTDELNKIEKEGDRLDYVDQFDRHKSFVSDFIKDIGLSPLRNSMFARYREDAPFGVNAFIFSILTRDLSSFSSLFWKEAVLKKIPHSEYKEHMIEMICLIEKESEFSDDRHEKNFLESFKIAITKAGRDYLEGSGYWKRQVEYPLTDTVQIVNLDNPEIKNEISIDNFIQTVKTATASTPSMKEELTSQIGMPVFYECEEMKLKGGERYKEYAEFESRYLQIIMKHLKNLENYLEKFKLDKRKIDLLSKVASSKHAFHLWDVSRLAGAQTFIENRGADLKGPLSSCASGCDNFYQWNYLLSLTVNLSEELHGDHFLDDISGDMAGMNSQSKYHAYDAVYEYISWHQKRPSHSVIFTGTAVNFSDVDKEEVIFLDDVATIIRECDSELLQHLTLNKEFLGINFAHYNYHFFYREYFQESLDGYEPPVEGGELLPFMTLTTLMSDNLIDLYFERKGYAFDYNWFFHWVRKRDFGRFSGGVWYRDDLDNEEVLEKIREQIREVEPFIKEEIISTTNPFERSFLYAFTIFIETRGSKSGFD